MSAHKAELQKIASAIYCKFKEEADRVGKKEFIVGRVKLAMAHGAKTYQQILDIALDTQLEQSESTHSKLPENDFLSLAYHCSQGGEWDGLDEYEPLSLTQRQTFLDIFAGNELRHDVLEAAWKIATAMYQKGITEQRLIQYEVGKELGAPHYEFEDEVDCVLSILQAAIGVRAGIKAQDSLYYVAVLKGGESCEVCRRLYLMPDGTPRIFQIENMPFSLANIGRDLKDWQPTIPPLHLHCTCRLYEFTGYEPWAKL